MKLCYEIRNRSDCLMVVRLGKGTDPNDFRGIFLTREVN
jgi:hypothetical protein